MVALVEWLTYVSNRASDIRVLFLHGLCRDSWMLADGQDVSPDAPNGEVMQSVSEGEKFIHMAVNRIRRWQILGLRHEA